MSQNENLDKYTRLMKKLWQSRVAIEGIFAIVTDIITFRVIGSHRRILRPVINNLSSQV